MGTDKAALEIGGMTLLEHTARLALAAGLPAIVVGRARPEGWPLPDVTFIADAELGLGPLGGLATALRHAQTSVLALACDLPLLTEDAVRWRAELSKGVVGEFGRVTVNHSQWEPLFSIYQPICLPLIGTRLAEGKRSLHGLIEAGEFVLDTAPDWVAGQLVNANTPKEWAEIGDPPGPQ